MQACDYAPIEHIFNLLSLVRQGYGVDPRRLRVAVRKRPLRALEEQPANHPWHNPRIPFWIQLCQDASLLADDNPVAPTLLVKDWLGWPPYQQFTHLLNTWLATKKHLQTRRARLDLWNCLQAGTPLNTSQQKELPGLCALGICCGAQLSEIGLALADKTGAAVFDPLDTRPWLLETSQITIPFPPDWTLLWDLECFFSPVKPGIYLLDENAKRLAAQRGAAGNSRQLQALLTRGLGAPPPMQILDQIVRQPTVCLYSGFILEFETPAALAEARQTSALRADLEELLSPRHALLAPRRAAAAIRRMEQHGLLCVADMAFRSPPVPQSPSQHISKADRASLLAAVLLRDALEPGTTSASVLGWLREGLSPALCAAAARRAQALLPAVEPVEHEHPPAPDEYLLRTIQEAITLAASIYVWYTASIAHAPEMRRITPLLIEQRGQRVYLIAHCHTRRANRTFRMDRLQLVNENMPG